MYVFVGRHLVGVWIGGVWNGHFPESEKYFSEAEICRKIPEIPQKERFLPNFRLRNLKFQSPKKCNSIPPAIPYPTRLPPNLLVSFRLSLYRSVRRQNPGPFFWKKGKDPHPQDKIQHLDFTKDPRPLYYKTPPCVFYHKEVCSKAVFGP